MAKTVEVGTARAFGSDAYTVARDAATRALAQIRELRPSLTLIFASARYDPDGVARGVAEITGDCPMVGTSSAGEICADPGLESVVVTVIGSPYLSAEVGVGEGVTGDWERAIRDALPNARGAAYFRDEPKLGRPFYFSHPTSGLSPLFALLVSPGMTPERPSRSHEIHSFLKRRTLGRIPIVGGSSSTPDFAVDNYQIANGRAYRDSVVLAVVETDLLFGEGVAHGFRPTRKRAVVTRAEGHVVYELDDLPAAEVSARLMGISPDELERHPIWFSRRPFGTADAYGQHHLLVPERVVEGGAVQFAPVMETMEAITLMEVDPERRCGAAREAVRKALAIGHVREPAAILLFTCSLRYGLDENSQEIEREGILNIGWDVPTSGFLTFGEYGLTEEGLPIYCNQSIVALVIGNEVDQNALATRRTADLLRAVEHHLDRKSLELAALRRASEITLNRPNWQQGLKEFQEILKDLTDATSVSFRLSDRLGVQEGSPVPLPDEGSIRFPLVFQGENLGNAVLHGMPTVETLDVAASICDLAARGIHRAFLERTIEEQAGEIGTLYTTAREIVTAKDYRTALSNIAQEIRRHVGAAGFSIWLTTESGGILCDYATGPDPHADFAVATRAVSSRCLERGLIRGHLYLAAPLLFKDRVNGVLVLFFPGNRAEPAGSERFLQHLSIPLAVMVEFYLRYRETNVAREIHHRVKNNLQIIASLLGLQRRRLSDPEAKEALETSIGRIMSIAVVHEALCEKQVGHVDAVPLVRTLADFVVQGMAEPNQRVAVTVDGPRELILSSQQATNLAVVANEMLNNALKHGLRGRNAGEIRVRLTEEKGEVVLTVTDNGKGLPSGFSSTGNRGLGLQLIATIAQNEFSGGFAIENGPGGTEARLAFPRTPPTT